MTIGDIYEGARRPFWFAFGAPLALACARVIA